MMENNKFSFVSVDSLFPRLSEENCRKVHEASLELLERVGVRLDHIEAVELLKKAGAKVLANQRVSIPASLVEEALAKAPKEVTLFNRRGEPVMPVAGNRCFYGAGSDCLNVLDHRTGKRRKARLKDVKEGVTLCDALSEIDFVMSMLLPSDVDTAIADRYQMEAMLTHSIKPIIFVTYEFEGCVDCIKMAEYVAGGIEELMRKPSVACYINVVSGLIHNKDALQKLLYLSSKNLPALYIPSSTAGVTSPITPAGSLALDYTGVLVGIVLSQLRREGAPIIIPGMSPGQLDMRTMVSTYCEPERGHGHAMAHFYGLPMFSLGGASEAKTLDQQAAAEAAMTLLVESFAGGNIIHDLGYLESGLTFSFQLLLICAEIVSWIKAFTRKFEVTDEALALDVTAAVGHDGKFLDTEHTLSHYKERWYPALFERKTFEAWKDEGSQDLAERTADKVESLLASHRSVPMSEDILEKLQEIIQRAVESKR
jgi:trimethylamine--corrinoid protein Co-methyltransferase